MSGDELRERYPGIFAAVRTGLTGIEPELLRMLVFWLGDYAYLKQRPGQPGVPEGVVAAQQALAEAHAAASNSRSDSRQREQKCLPASEFVLSGHDSWVGTSAAAALLGISADGVRWHCRRGNLESRKVGRQVMVSMASIESLRAHLDERKGA
jgi:hypothetical protein